MQDKYLTHVTITLLQRFLLDRRNPQQSPVVKLTLDSSAHTRVNFNLDGDSLLYGNCIDKVGHDASARGGRLYYQKSHHITVILVADVRQNSRLLAGFYTRFSNNYERFSKYIYIKDGLTKSGRFANNVSVLSNYTGLL